MEQSFLTCLEGKLAHAVNLKGVSEIIEEADMFIQASLFMMSVVFFSGQEKPNE